MAAGASGWSGIRPASPADHGASPPVAFSVRGPIGCECFRSTSSTCGLAPQLLHRKWSKLQELRRRCIATCNCGVIAVVGLWYFLFGWLGEQRPEDEIFGKFPFHHRHFDGLLVLERGWIGMWTRMDMVSNDVHIVWCSVEVASVLLL